MDTSVLLRLDFSPILSIAEDNDNHQHHLNHHHAIATRASVASDLMEDKIVVYEYPKYLRNFGTFTAAILLIVGLIGNTTVPIVVLYNKRLRNSTHFFLINLSIADLLVLLFCIPTVLVELNSLPEVWLLGAFMCKATAFIEVFVAHGSILTIMAISFERYYAICKPLQAGYRCTRRRAIILIFIIWLLSFATTLPINWITDLQTAEYIDGREVEVCTNQLQGDWHPYYYVASFVILFWIPFFVLLYLFIHIYRKLNSTFTQDDIVSSGCSLKRIKTRKQVVHILMTVWLLFFFCLLPYRILGMWIIFTPESDIVAIGMEKYSYITYFCRIMVYVNSAINPIVYNIISSRFRQGLMKALGLKDWLKKRKHIKEGSFGPSFGQSFGPSSIEFRADKVTTNSDFHSF